MSRLTDLLRQVRKDDTQLGADLETEIRAITSRRTFGLVFERHVPEEVELPQRPVRKGDKVHVLQPRGETARGDQRLWSVVRFESGKGGRKAHLVELRTDAPETRVEAVENLAVVAEFRDPIYPGLIETGRKECGGDKPFHTVINAENYHALELLTYTHRGKIDAIYIDPPYNTRDNDWKYNNDYVDPNDDYAHSKWLAFMERRLNVAKVLLNPNGSALIVTIDEKEVFRLGLLLEQTFPDGTIQMVTSVISAKGAVRRGRFSRVEENIFFVTFGDAKIHPWENNMLPSYSNGDQRDEDEAAEDESEPLLPIEWLGLRRREPSSVRGARPNQFYPIFVNVDDGTIHSVGNAIEDDVDRHSVAAPEGTAALWPLKPNGTEMLWGLTPEVLRSNGDNGYVRVNNWKKANLTGTVQYLPSGTIDRIRSGAITITGRAPDNSVVGHVTEASSQVTPPKRVWNLASHNAENGGTKILSALIPNRQFPYPKSLYAVEDALRFVVGPNKDAVVLDFFAGSGTTAHAVMRLNRQDEGRRQCILVTNNEVAPSHQLALRGEGLRPGDPNWECWGICDYITKPRIEAAITGLTPDGESVTGNYRFVDKFPMSDGLEENAVFFTLTYEGPLPIAHHRAFGRVASMLWLRAGARGEIITTIGDQGWAITETYGVLDDPDAASGFVKAVGESETLTLAYIVTDDDLVFQMVCRDLPTRVTAVQLYESYLQNFELNSGRLG